MTESKSTTGPIDPSTRPDEILSHDAEMRLKNDVQRDAKRASEMPGNQAKNVIIDAEETAAKAGKRRHHDAN